MYPFDSKSTADQAAEMAEIFLKAAENFADAHANPDLVEAFLDRSEEFDRIAAEYADA